MVELNFCPKCGQKRLEHACFCVHCGQRQIESKSNAWPQLLVSALLVSILVLAVIRFVLPREASAQLKASKATQTQEHHHDDPPALASLREKAESGEVSSLMDLADAEINNSAHDQQFLVSAAKTLERVVASYPDHGYALRLLANIYYDLGDSERSCALYSRFLKFFPNDANARVDLGSQLLKLNLPEQAIIQYEKALVTFPNFYNAYYNMSIAYHQLGKQEEAEIYKQTALDIEKKFGNLLATALGLPRLPTQTPVSVQSPKLESGGIDYAQLHAFFKFHPIIGPKMTAFKAESGGAIMDINNFPMDKMPPAVRSNLEIKINNMLTALGPQARLIIRDDQDGRTIASYHKE